MWVQVEPSTRRKPEFPGIWQIGNDVVFMRAIECDDESKLKSDEIRGISRNLQPLQSKIPRGPRHVCGGVRVRESLRDARLATSVFMRLHLCYHTRVAKNTLGFLPIRFLTGKLPSRDW
jgi:hypothetical protein